MSRGLGDVYKRQLFFFFTIGNLGSPDQVKVWSGKGLIVIVAILTFRWEKWEKLPMLLSGSSPAAKIGK